MHTQKDIKKLALAFAQVEYFNRLQEGKVINPFENTPVQIQKYDDFIDCYTDALDYFSNVEFDRQEEDTEI